MGIISSLDSQSFLLTRKLLERVQSPLLGKLSESHPSRFPITLELELETINGIISELITLAEQWLEDPQHEHHDERRKILAYILKQWIKLGEDAKRLTEDCENHVIH